MIIDNESLWAILGTMVGIFIGSYFTYNYMKLKKKSPTKCKLCKKDNDMLTTDYCLECFMKLSKYTHQIAMESLEEVGLTIVPGREGVGMGMLEEPSSLNY